MAMTNAAQFFDQLQDRMSNDSDAQGTLKDLGATYQFDIEGEGGGHFTLKLGELTVSEGQDEGADCTVGMAAEDFLGMVNGELRGDQLFMMGKLMISGDMALALQLQQVFDAAE